jgi:hypothetical protein
MLVVTGRYESQRNALISRALAITALCSNKCVDGNVVADGSQLMTQGTLPHTLSFVRA